MLIISRMRWQIFVCLAVLSLTRAQTMAEHTVKQGDTLSAISKTFYGETKLYPELAAANSIADANVIKVGQKINIPDHLYLIDSRTNAKGKISFALGVYQCLPPAAALKAELLELKFKTSVKACQNQSAVSPLTGRVGAGVKTVMARCSQRCTASRK